MNYNKKTVKDIDVAGKKVLLRCDFNVPRRQAHPCGPAHHPVPAGSECRRHRLLSYGQARGYL